MRKPRRPPRPQTWDSPKGSCRFCGDTIIEKGVQNFRKNWHTDCISLWKIISSPSVARRHIWHRDKGVCAGCGKDSWAYGDSWQVDHRNPLFEADNDLSFWHPENLRLLCTDCHKKKTAEEAARRALQKKKTGIDHGV